MSATKAREPNPPQSRLRHSPKPLCLAPHSSDNNHSLSPLHRRLTAPLGVQWLLLPLNPLVMPLVMPLAILLGVRPGHPALLLPQVLTMSLEEPLSSRSRHVLRHLPLPWMMRLGVHSFLPRSFLTPLVAPHRPQGPQELPLRLAMPLEGLSSPPLLLFLLLWEPLSWLMCRPLLRTPDRLQGHLLLMAVSPDSSAGFSWPSPLPLPGAKRLLAIEPAGFLRSLIRSRRTKPQSRVSEFFFL